MARKREDVFDFDKTRELDVTDIYPLVEDMKKVRQEEWFGDFYSIGRTLREYAELPQSYQINGNIEHAPQLSNVVEGGFGIHKTRASIVCSPYRAKIIENAPNNHGAYAVGPYIAYAKHAYSKEKLEKEKKRLGKNLLVFPTHSTLGLKVTYDMENFCEEINDIGKDFDSIRICLYWKDVLDGAAKFYEKEGYEVVTAGHYYDPLFLSRQKSIIETSTKTMSNHMGSYVGFCIHMNKPHYVTPFSDSTPVPVKEEGEGLSERQFAMFKKVSNIMESDPEYMELLRAFSINLDKISFQQRRLTNKYWGSEMVKTPRELRELLFMLDGKLNYKNQINTQLIRTTRTADKLKASVNDLQNVVDEHEKTISIQNMQIDDLKHVTDRNNEILLLQKEKINNLTQERDALKSTKYWIKFKLKNILG